VEHQEVRDLGHDEISRGRLHKVGANGYLHIKNNYMRNPLAMDVFNEEICTLLKKKIKGSLVSVDDLSIRFSYQGETSLQDSEEILERITTVHNRILKVASSTKNEGRKRAF
jgi:hypothetical protein